MGITKDTIFIIAGSLKQAKDFARSKRIKPDNFRYVDRPDRLRGIHRGLSFVRVGTWFERESRELDEISILLKDREAVELFWELPGEE